MATLTKDETLGLLRAALGCMDDARHALDSATGEYGQDDTDARILALASDMIAQVALIVTSADEMIECSR